MEKPSTQSEALLIEHESTESDDLEYLEYLKARLQNLRGSSGLRRSLTQETFIESDDLKEPDDLENLEARLQELKSDEESDDLEHLETRLQELKSDERSDDLKDLEAELQKLQVSDRQQESKSNEFQLESSTESEFERYKNTIEFAADIAATHERNEELKGRVAVKQFFEKVKSMNSIKGDEQREWIGSLPSTMATDAVPLFTDHDTETDYQLHFSYTWMNALHTYKEPTLDDTSDSESDAIPDYYVHSLLHVREDHKPELISNPNLIIPLGKLFVNESGHSEWTGYEILVSSNLELWIIYFLDESGVQKWHPKECSLSRLIQSMTQSKMLPSSKITRLVTSLRTLETASFMEARRTLEITYGENAMTRLRNPYTENYLGSFYLLEISMHEVSEAVCLSEEPVHKILVSEKLRINAKSSAGRELLELAVENDESTIMKLEFVNRFREDDNDDTLEYLATAANDRDILRLLRMKDLKRIAQDIHSYLKSH